MAAKIKTKPNKELKTKFRFVVLNDATFEEKFSLILTRTNVWLFGGVVVFTLVFLTAAAIIYTPFKYYIPGFGDYNYRSQILQLQFKADSLQDLMVSRELWLENVMNVTAGVIDSTQPKPQVDADFEKSKTKLSEVSEADKKLRQEVEEEENFSLSAYSGAGSQIVEEVKRMHPITPVEGYVTEDYNALTEHYGIDIAAKEEAPVKAVLDGKVIAADYTLETGYVITVQHTNNTVSIYKHNSKLLLKEGQTVKAGDVVAIVGNTGELTTGPHLHFELWYEGKSLNPRDYILF